MAKPSGRPRRSEADITTMRSKIAGHALRLFRDEGYDAVSIRRLAKEAGCAPMTIYAHFDTKTDILRHLWADVLNEVFAGISAELITVTDPVARLQIAAHSFVGYWQEHPDHFRLVFMSSDVSRSDVGVFLEQPQSLGYFDVFADLIRAAVTEGDDVRGKTDTLVAGMIGIALCLNTLRDHPWSATKVMTGTLVAGLLAG